MAIKPKMASCPECGESAISNSCSTTLLGMSSPPGHDHDDNCRVYSFRCSTGHAFSARFQNECPTPGCEWKGKLECFCHPLGAKSGETWMHQAEKQGLLKPRSKAC